MFDMYEFQFKYFVKELRNKFHKSILIQFVYMYILF